MKPFLALLVLTTLAACSHAPVNSKRDIASEDGYYRDLGGTKWVFQMVQFGLEENTGWYGPVGKRAMTENEIRQIIEGTTVHVSKDKAYFGKPRDYNLEFNISGNEATLNDFRAGPFWVSISHRFEIKYAKEYYRLHCVDKALNDAQTLIETSCFEHPNQKTITKELTDADFSLIEGVDLSGADLGNKTYRRAYEYGFYNFESSKKIISKMAKVCPTDPGNSICGWDGLRTKDLSVVELDKWGKLNTKYDGFTTIKYNREKNYIYGSVYHRTAVPEASFYFQVDILKDGKLKLTPRSSDRELHMESLIFDPEIY